MFVRRKEIGSERAGKREISIGEFSRISSVRSTSVGRSLAGGLSVVVPRKNIINMYEKINISISTP